MMIGISPWAPVSLILMVIRWIIENLRNIVVIIVGGGFDGSPSALIQGILALLYSWL